MARKTATRAKRRAPLNRERVLSAALAFVDERGLEELSMRKLAQKLGVEAMSLYNHVDNKDDIVGGILDLVGSETESPSAGGDWKAEIRRSALSTHEAFSRHPWAAKIWMSTPRPSGDGMRRADVTLRCLAEAGFSDDLAYHAYHVLQGYTLGFTLQEMNFPYDREELKQLAAKFLRDFPADEYPHLATHIAQHVEPPHAEAGAFGLGLDLILDGLERLRDAT